MSLMSWLRRRYYRDDNPAQLAARPLGGFGKGFSTPFDAPSPEKVELDPDLPWELRE